MKNNVPCLQIVSNISCQRFLTSLHAHDINSMKTWNSPPAEPDWPCPVECDLPNKSSTLPVWGLALHRSGNFDICCLRSLSFRVRSPGCLDRKRGQVKLGSKWGEKEVTLPMAGTKAQTRESDVLGSPHTIQVSTERSHTSDSSQTPMERRTTQSVGHEIQSITTVSNYCILGPTGYTSKVIPLYLLQINYTETRTHRTVIA